MSKMMIRGTSSNKASSPHQEGQVETGMKVRGTNMRANSDNVRTVIGSSTTSGTPFLFQSVSGWISYSDAHHQ